MQGHITLSRKEKQYQFVYLILMLIAALIFLGIIFLKGFESPFSDEDMISIRNLEEKAKFDQQQKFTYKLMDSTFSQINRLSDETPQPFEENNIMYGINDIANYYENNNGIADIRKDAYPQIAKFYKMYFNDKKIIASKTENIKSFEKQFEECSIGFREKKNQLFQRENALKARTQ
ncbi:type VI secretion system transmembrane protein TssO [uncultured Chryseobacterium sp.]|uniref:type VI secretion system transmembrane protein TssO n=1 Tax=uncultured Chryseobacterium sp. TaxID=259322 RepID=UPI0025FA0659|nr:type VI secretion system transmembrane protein TssO [uncultured Chryseobacterium sp.]